MRSVWVLPRKWHRFKVALFVDNRIVHTRWFLSESYADRYAERLLRDK